MMIGLLQSGTGIGRGMWPPICASGFSGVCDTDGCETGLRTVCWAPCPVATTVAPELAAGLVNWRLPRATALLRLPGAARTAERRARVERARGWAVPPRIRGADTAGADEEELPAPADAGPLEGLAALEETEAIVAALGALAALALPEGLEGPVVPDELGGLDSAFDPPEEVFPDESPPRDRPPEPCPPEPSLEREPSLKCPRCEWRCCACAGSPCGAPAESEGPLCGAWSPTDATLCVAGWPSPDPLPWLCLGSAEDPRPAAGPPGDHEPPRVGAVPWLSLPDLEGSPAGGASPCEY